jgi:hypothetical protein
MTRRPDSTDCIENDSGESGPAECETPTRVGDAMRVPTVQDLFALEVPRERLHPSFRLVLESPGYEPSRVMMQRVYDQIGDRDGNFRRQLQTEGFDARVWELYLYAALRDAGYEVDASEAVPDFILSRGSLRWALEATTANTRPADPTHLPQDPEELLAYLSDELPIRLGSPLYSKLTKDYPALPQVAGIPFVIGLECFVTEDAVYLSENVISTYVYGLRTRGVRQSEGGLEVITETVHERRVRGKVIPSGFFRQEGTQAISAILFANSGTVGKFGRMAYQEGIRGNVLTMMRRGARYVQDPNASEPAPFEYEVGSRWERWGEGLVMLHNPNATLPLDDDVFPDAAHYRLEDGQITTVAPPFHAFISQTVTAVTAPPTPG